MPPQYTVQLVGLDWLYTSSKVKGLEFAAKEEGRKCHIQLSSQKDQGGGGCRWAALCAGGVALRHARPALRRVL